MLMLSCIVLYMASNGVHLLQVPMVQLKILQAI